MTDLFCNLTTRNKKQLNIKRILNKDTMELNYLFKNSNKTLEAMTVVDAERRIALENLRKLTDELQTKRLRYNAKAFCKYFTL